MLIVECVPGRFIRDCGDCGVDVGEYDHKRKILRATPEQLAELIDRAELYTDAWGPDDCPPEIKRAAGALLKRLPRKGITREPHYNNVPMRIINGCIVQKIPKWDPHDDYAWKVVAPKGYRFATGGSFTNSATLAEATWRTTMLEKGEPV